MPSNNSSPEWFPHDDPALLPQTNDGIRLVWQNLYSLRAQVAAMQASITALQLEKFGGDVAGNASAAVVTGIQGRKVAAVQPKVGQKLEWDGTQWVPTT